MSKRDNTIGSTIGNNTNSTFLSTRRDSPSILPSRQVSLTSNDGEHHAVICSNKQSTTKTYVNPYAKSHATVITATNTVFNSPSNESTGKAKNSNNIEDFDEYGDESWCHDSELLSSILKSTTKKQTKNTTTTTSVSTTTTKHTNSSYSVLDDTRVTRTLFGDSNNATTRNTKQQQRRINDTTKQENKRGNVKGNANNKAESISSDNESKKRKSRGSNSSIEEGDKKLKQLTLTQQLRENAFETTTDTIHTFVEYGGRHFKSGDVFYRNPDPDKPDDVLNNAFVTIVRVKTSSNCAMIENEFYKRLEDTYIGKEEAAYVCAGSQKYVKCILTLSYSGDDNGNTTNNISTTLNLLGERRDPKIEGPIDYEYDYYIDEKERTKSFTKNRKPTSTSTKKEHGDTKYNPSKVLCCYKSVPTTDNSNVNKSPSHAALLASLDNGKPTVLNLYAGGGGMSLGLKEAGFHGKTDSVDSDTSSCSTLNANFPDSIVHQYTVKDFLIGCRHNPYSTRYPRIGSITLLHGSTPCQGSSRANRTGGANDDANNEETYQFIDVVEYFQPPYVTFENVVGMNDIKNRHYLQRMIARLLVMGYQVRLFSLNSVEYGDPQFRERIFIIAAKNGLELPNVPKPTHGNRRHLYPIKTAGNVLGFLEDINPLEYEGIIRINLPNSGVAVEVEGHTLKTAKLQDSDIRLTKDNPARTVLKARTVRHYKNMNRPLTRLEQSQLQSFPKTYKFKGTDDEIRDQIGNAVPVNLAYAIGLSVMDAIRLSTGGG